MGGLIAFYNKHMHRLNFTSLVFKAVVAFIVVCTLELLTNDSKFNTFEYFQSINMIWHLIAIGILFITLFLINKPLVDKVLFVIFSMILCCVASAMANNFYLCLACCIFMAGVIAYTFKNEIIFEPSKKITIILITLLGSFFVFYASMMTVYGYKNYMASCYDFGIFAQMYEYMKDTFQPLTTCERDQLLSHFAIHFSPVYYLLLPVYFIFPSPVTLLISQSVIIALGLLPLYLLCKHYKLSNSLTLLVAVCYTFLPSVMGGCYYYFHENKFLCVLLLFMIYFVERSKAVPAFIFTLLTLSVKEDAAVYVAVAGLYFLFSGKRKQLGAGITVFAVLYFVGVTGLMKQYGHGIMSDRYDNFMYDGSHSLTTVIKSVILNPLYAINESFQEKKIKFILQMLAPLAFLPVMIKKPSRIILLIPFFLVNLMTNYPYQYEIGYQYTYGNAALLFYLLLQNNSEMNEKLQTKSLLISAFACVIMFFGLNAVNAINYVNIYYSDIERYNTIDEAVESIPEDASVLAGTYYIPHLYKHKILYSLEISKNKAEYIMFNPANETTEYDRNYYLNSGNFETVYHKEGIIIVLRDLNYNGS